MSGEGLNQVTLIGNLGADPEWRNTAGDGVLQLRLATTESYLDRNKDRKEITEWHTVVVWGRRGEALGRILTKGSKIAVIGSLRTSSWDANDGTKRYRTQIVAKNVLLCGGGNPQQQRGAAPTDRGEPTDWSRLPDPEDDIPF